MKTKGRLILVAALAAGASALVGCGKGASDNSGAGSTEDVGSVSLALQLASGGVINTFSYSLTGPSSKTGTIDVSQSTTVSAVIGPIAAGSGYVVSLTGTTTDGTTTCTGTSGMFTVTPKMTAAVTVGIACRKAATTGSVLISGVLNFCPSIDSVSANPPQGTSIAIFASAHDNDNAPSPLSYHWTTSSGTLSDANAQNPTLTCTAPGNVTLTVTATDGDPACSDTFTLLVACPPDSALGDPAWVEIGANNQAIARLITPYRRLSVDHRRRHDVADEPARRPGHRADPPEHQRSGDHGDDRQHQAVGVPGVDLRIQPPRGRDGGDGRGPEPAASEGQPAAHRRPRRQRLPARDRQPLAGVQRSGRSTRSRWSRPPQPR